MLYQIKITKHFKDIDTLFQDPDAYVAKDSTAPEGQIFSHWKAEVRKVGPPRAYLIALAETLVQANTALSSIREDFGGLMFANLPERIYSACTLEQTDLGVRIVLLTAEDGYVEDADYIEGEFYAYAPKDITSWFLISFATSPKVLLNIDTKVDKEGSTWSFKEFVDVIEENTDDWMDNGCMLEDVLYKIFRTSPSDLQAAFNCYDNPSE